MAIFRKVKSRGVPQWEVASSASIEWAGSMDGSSPPVSPTVSVGSPVPRDSVSAGECGFVGGRFAAPGWMPLAGREGSNGWRSVAGQIHGASRRVLRSAVAACAIPGEPRGSRGGSGEAMMLGVVAVSAFLVVFVIGLVGAHEPAVPRETGVLQVQHGDTLWALARRHSPASDPDAVVRRIVELNGLGRPAISYGQRLEVPTVGD